MFRTNNFIIRKSFLYTRHTVFLIIYGCLAANTIRLEHPVDAGGILYVASTEITSWWWTCFFETCTE